MKILILFLILLIPSPCASGLLDLNWDVPNPSKPVVMGPLVGDNLSGKWRPRR